MTYQDAALSGFGIEHRPGYQQLVAAALAGAAIFDTILVEDLSRLTRDTGELLRLYHRLRLKGIELVGVSDGIATAQQGAKVHLTVKGLANELYLDDLREKTHRGLAGRMTRGLSSGGRIFGYRTVPVGEARGASKPSTSARFEIDPPEADVVRRIFQAYAHGRSMRAIAHALNGDLIPFPAQNTQRGPHRRAWATSSVRVILRNGKYVGVWVWNKRRFLKDPDTGRRRQVARPPDEWIRQEHPELRIVDADVWRAVQERSGTWRRPTASRRTAPRGAPRTWPIRSICSPGSSDAASAAPGWSPRRPHERNAVKRTGTGGTGAASPETRARPCARTELRTARIVSRGPCSLPSVRR